MHINTFDHYQTRNSLIHRLDPRVKVVVTVLLILSNVILPDGAWLAFALTWGMLLFCSLFARISPRFLITRSFVALPFAFAAVTAIFTIPGQAVFEFNISSWHLTASDAGLIRFFSILIRGWISVQMAILLTASTPFPDLVHALRHLRIPDIIVATISFMYRYLFVLSDETVRLLRAREARSASLTGKRKRGGSIRWRARVAGSMAGQLFLRSYERSERIYNAMLARGYRGTLMTLNPHEMQPKDWALGVIALVMLVIIQIVGRNYSG
ncbi:MAG: cobalt ECF transporter T component CbiQ [Anaerolineales bacterium]|nr:cobalt ECF transporter T component CbiQ [Anaerolineales bacterium]